MTGCAGLTGPLGVEIRFAGPVNVGDIASGRLKIIVAAAGETYPVGTVLGEILD